MFSRLRDLNPLRTLYTHIPYQRLPSWSSGDDSDNGSPTFKRRIHVPTWAEVKRWEYWTSTPFAKLLGAAIAIFVLLGLVFGSAYQLWEWIEDDNSIFQWQEQSKLEGYFNGVRTLVPYGKYDAENRYNKSVPPTPLSSIDNPRLSPMPPLDPVVYDPVPKSNKVAQCFLDEEEKVRSRDIYVYPGLPQNMAQPFYGSYNELGLREDVCFERFGRLGPYGFGHPTSLGGNGTGLETEKFGSEKIFAFSGFTDFRNVDWGAAQKRCFEKNRGLFEKQESADKTHKRHAFVLRTWNDFNYTEHHIFTIRAMVNELSLKSGGEYDVHLLVQMKNDSIPIWADESVYNRTLRRSVPREFWNIATLWSETQTKMYYPGPFTDNFANMVESSIHTVYRSPHFALQWFSQQHPEYDFFWNWEMDLRYTGHYYEFASKIGDWAKKQPRKGLWERSRRFWFPEFHGNYEEFSKFVERETFDVDVPKNDKKKSGPMPVWGPVQDFKNYGMLPPPDQTTPPTSYKEDNYEWGVGEDADLLTFNPIFDPSLTNWQFRLDTTGYNASLPIPPRRAAIITVSRMSKHLLDIMHEEVWRQRHTMFPEMWPASVSLHHGLKAVYVPHPVYFNRDWDLERMNQQFNYPKEPHQSVFGWGENLQLGSTFYYNSPFAAQLWRRWLGQREKEHGGPAFEEVGTGRMCLRGTLLHPIKHEDSPYE